MSIAGGEDYSVIEGFTRSEPTAEVTGVRIGQVADRAGVTATTVRFYESIGLLPDPGRTPSGYRDYDDEALARLAFIRDAQAAGLTLAEVRSLLDMKAAGQPTCEHTRDLLNRHLEDIEAQIASLRAARVELEALAARADTLHPGACTDPNRCHIIGDGTAGGHAQLDLEVQVKV